MDLGPVASYVPTEIDGDAREAAVLVPVVERSEPAILFTRRADHLDDHPGQMSFPGGGREPGDADLEATARREADEEIGLARDEAVIVGRLDDLETITEYAVRPFVVTIPDRTYTPCDQEVAEVAVLSLAALTDRDNYESEHRDHPTRGPVRLHFFHVDGHTVWGATARMLVQFLELATDWTLPPGPDRGIDADADADLPT